MSRYQVSRQTDSMSALQQALFAVLLVVVAASAIGVVYSRFQARILFNELESLHTARDELDVEWDRLQLEEGTIATDGLIEEKARTELDMQLPSFDAVEHIAP